MPAYLSKPEAAARLGVSVKTVERHLKAGKLRGTVLHTAAGPRVRVVFDDAPDVVEAAYTVVPATNDDTTTYDTSTIVEGVALAPSVATETADLVAAVLRALDEKQREVEGWARRYGRLEAEVEALRRAQTDAHGPLRRLWARFRGG
jgi:excisionase family DNA binding protein